MKDLEGFKERYALNSRRRQEGRQAGRRGLPGRRPLRQGDPRDRPAPRSGDPVRDADDEGGDQRAGQVLPHRRGGRSRRLRRRLGPGQGLAGGHDQRVHRGLHGSARPQGIVGSARLLREPREDRGDPEDRRQRPVVRGPDALGRPVQEAGRPRHHRQRHRRRHRDRRLRADHADRHQPAERSEHPREARQQVGVALERERGLRPSRRRRRSAASSRGRKRRRCAPRSGTASPAS